MGLRKRLTHRDQLDSWLRLPCYAKSRTHSPPERRKKVKKSRLMRIILPSPQAASESPSLRQEERASRRNVTGSQR
jgi:hypothetical protein